MADNIVIAPSILAANFARLGEEVGRRSGVTFGHRFTILSMANKMPENYGPDAIDIRVVAMGPGIQLLQRDNANWERVDSLVAHGVTFNVCGNALDTIERETGNRQKTTPKAVAWRAVSAFTFGKAVHHHQAIGARCPDVP